MSVPNIYRPVTETERELSEIARVQRIGQMGPKAFARYVDTLVEIRRAVRQRAAMERLEVLAADLAACEQTTAEMEARSEDAL